ncbi:MAG: TonB-dependent receptor [Pyrinomonadaceae bacterium]|nr:TonB-dependent receptor [Pyrinomonadaceae bacterium]
MYQAHLNRLTSASAYRGSIFFLLAIAVLTLSTATIFAQGTRGTISGTVRDPNGAVVPNATVRLIDPARNAEVRTVQSNTDGEYRFVEIEPSTYNVVVVATGFEETTVSNIRVEPNRNVTTDVSIGVGGTSAEVTVTAGVELIDKESPTLGTTVDRRRVQDLPLNGREVLNLAALQPGVAPAAGAFGNGLGIRVNGSRGVENNLTLDGGNNNEVAVGGATAGQPRPDAIQEFRLPTSNFEAEFGRNTGAVINVVTRSGTNRFSGNARFFYRPTGFSAARFIDKALPPAGTAPGADLRRKFDRKDYGFNFGGPIYFPNFGEGVSPIYDGKDRSFFFVDYERRWQVLGQSQTLPTLPTAAERNGVFSQTILDPATGLPFPNNTIPQERISPIARYYLGFIPAATAGGQAQVSANQETKNNWLTARIDHSINQSHVLNFTYNYFDSDVFSPFAFGGANVPGFAASDLRETANYIGRYTYVITPNLVNTFLVNYSTNEQPGVAPVNQTTPAEIGFTSNFVADGTFVGPPQIRLLDRGIILGNSIQGPQRRFTENIQFQDSVSWVAGDHRMKFGVDFTKYKQDTDFLFINQGLISYSAVGLVGVTNTTGDDFADLLLGNSPAAVQFGAAGQRDYRQRAWALFGQDTWRVTNNLTLSFGLRYEYNSPLTDLFNRVAYFRAGQVSTLLTSGQLRTPEGQVITVPAGGRAPVGLVYVGDPDPVLGGTVPEGGVKPDKNNFAPRLGLAWSLGSPENGLLRTIIGKDQTVIRAGFGLYYGAVIGDTALQQLSAPGYNGTNFFRFPASGTLADLFAPDPYPDFGGNQGTVPNPFAQSSFFVSAPLSQMSQPIDPNMRTPQTTQFNVTLERGFADDYVVGLSYVGSRGRKLYVREQINPSLGTFLPSSLRSQPTPAPTTANANSRRLYDDFRLGLTQLTSGSNSTYDSFQANFQKRLSDDGLLFQLAYTFSKSINDSDSQRGQLDLLDRSFGRGLSDDDVPHRFVGSFLYELPFFKNTTGFAKRILDGWSIGGIYTYASGRVFSVGNPVDIDGTGGALINFADIGPGGYTTFNGVDSDRRAFNANAFATVNCGTSFQLCGGVGRRGTSGRNQFRLDNPVNNWDAILIKRIKLFSETNNLELRFEAFNLLNTTQFTTVNLNLSSPNFGVYTDTRESRSVQLGARLNF